MYDFKEWEEFSDTFEKVPVLRSGIETGLSSLTSKEKDSSLLPHWEESIKRGGGKGISFPPPYL
jgi:hypothetical protein